MDAPARDDFPSFGNNFDGFPKRLPDDCVEYSLFVIDAKLKSQKELVSRLETIRKEAHKLADGLLQEYIWQRDGFKLELESEKGASSSRPSAGLGLTTTIRDDVFSRNDELWGFCR